MSNRGLISKMNLRILPSIIELYLEQRVVGVADDREIIISGHRETANAYDVTVVTCDSSVTVKSISLPQACSIRNIAYSKDI